MKVLNFDADQYFSRQQMEIPSFLNDRKIYKFRLLVLIKSSDTIQK